MRFLHTMLRVRDLDAALRFWCGGLGMIEHRRIESAAGRYTLVFLRADEEAEAAQAPEVELTWNWDNAEPYPVGRFFGHLAWSVQDIYQTCARLQERGVAVLRPPRDGRMAFVQSPDGQSVELLQRGPSLPPQEPWLSMPNSGSW